MISYIFQNKTKNILAIVFTALCAISPLVYFIKVLPYFPLTFVYHLIKLLPYLLILTYLLTLKYKYKFKNILFPMAFIIKAMDPIYSIISIIRVYGYENSEQMALILSFVANIIIITGCVLCAIGSAFNFRWITIFKAGIIILIAHIVLVMPIIDFIFVGGFEYFKILPQEYIPQVIVSTLKTMLNNLPYIMYYISFLLLTLNKKGEYIDITPFVDARKAKKEAKRNARLEAKQQQEAKFNAPVPEIPDGSWRCMACGKILSDSIYRCECGYKK